MGAPSVCCRPGGERRHLKSRSAAAGQRDVVKFCQFPASTPPLRRDNSMNCVAQCDLLCSRHRGVSCPIDHSEQRQRHLPNDFVCSALANLTRSCCCQSLAECFKLYIFTGNDIKISVIYLLYIYLFTSDLSLMS